MEMTAEEKRIEEEALAYAKKHRNEMARRLTDPKIFVSEVSPVSVFMAGSPGAGKTEASIELINLKGADGAKVLRIDPDELREEFPGYTGENAWLFQRAVIPIVERIHDLALEQEQSFLLDGTLSSYSVAEKNIQRSLKRGRTVQILYVYQEPQQAWQFVQAREAAEGRRIQPEDFVRQYFAAREVVNRLKAKFGKSIQVDLLMKNNDGSHQFYRAGVDQIDNHIPEKYSVADVRRMLGLN
ncbi:MAG TPA: zeta toxin family protein [Candidatus Methylomirabilis sp.]|nr:zeta toxin family protein [Candidatus Methylomirabilis sp.]